MINSCPHVVLTRDVVVAGRGIVFLSLVHPPTRSPRHPRMYTPSIHINPRTATMSITYRFTSHIKMKGARLVPGVISEKEVCSIFKADLKTFEIEQPKDQAIRQMGQVYIVCVS